MGKYEELRKRIVKLESTDEFNNVVLAELLNSRNRHGKRVDALEEFVRAKLDTKADKPVLIIDWRNRRFIKDLCSGKDRRVK